MSTTITLKVSDKGHLVELPGVAPFRTPAKINVTNADIKNVILHLKACGIEEYEIKVSTDSGSKQVYTQADFELPTKEAEKVDSKTYDRKIDERFNRLEKMITKLATQKVGDQSNNKEQITNKLDVLETIAQRILDEATVREVVYTKMPGEIKEDNIEELEDAYVPEVDISDMKFVSTGVETIKQDSDDIESAADILSNLTGKRR